MFKFSFRRPSETHRRTFANETSIDRLGKFPSFRATRPDPLFRVAPQTDLSTAHHKTINFHDNRIRRTTRAPPYCSSDDGSFRPREPIVIINFLPATTHLIKPSLRRLKGRERAVRPLFSQEREFYKSFRDVICRNEFISCLRF